VGTNYCNQGEVNENFAFERSCQPFADAFYISRGYKIDRVQGKQNKLGDVYLSKNGSVFLIEEKFLRQELNFMFVEIVQDVKTNNIGWLWYTGSEYIFYCMPETQYFCHTERLRNFIREFGDFYKTLISRKGWGQTENKAVDWGTVIHKKIAKKVKRNIFQ